MADNPCLSHDDYTVGWICALPLELAAGAAMLDEEHATPLNHPQHDHNTYTCGRIGLHNVVLACLPTGTVGVTSAATVAVQMRNTFRRLRFGLMVGIGGGVPSKETDMRLGDIVVCSPTRRHGGVIQYDFGKRTQEGRFKRTGTLNKPPEILLNAVSNLHANHLRKGYGFIGYLSTAFDKYPNMAHDFARPEGQTDILYEADYDHPEKNTDCSHCTAEKLIVREARAKDTIVHYGLIASGNLVMRHGETRDKLGQEEGAICFEMEAAGLMDKFPCLVVRGICDYADSHKSKIWQPYAAMVAACYTKELLNIIPGGHVTDMRPITETKFSGVSTSTQITASPTAAPARTASPAPITHQPTHSRPERFEDDSIVNNERHWLGRREHQSADRLHGLRDSGVATGSAIQSDQANDSRQTTLISSSLGGHPENPVPSLAEKDLQLDLKKFTSDLSPRQHADFSKTTLEDLRVVLVRIEKEQAERWKAMNLPRADMFSERVQRFGNASNFSIIRDVLANIWGSMKFVLQATASSVEAFEARLDAYEQVADSMSLDDVDLQWLAQSPEGDNALGKVFDDIMQFHMHVLQMLIIPTWRQIFSSLWEEFTYCKDHIVSDLRRYQQLARTRGTAAEFHEHHWKRKHALKELEQGKLQRIKGQLGAVLQWLGGTDNEMDHEDNRAVRRDSPDSGQWFLKHPNFVSWREDDIPPNPGLWLSGIPGAGKTVLASAAIDDCKQARGMHTAYFYFRHGDTQRSTLISILKSILRQLTTSDQSQRLLPWCHDQLQLGNQLSPSEKTFRTMLRMMVLTLDKIFLIVDGLDECDQKDRKPLLTLLSELVSECDFQDPGKLRVLVVSRDEPDIRRNLPDFVEVAVKPADNERDIKHFIIGWRQKIQAKFEDLGEADLDYICTSTLNRAEGMFLFAKLVMENLYEQITLEDLMQQISPHYFPEKLDQAYARILDRISKDERPGRVATAQKILGLMICARRPLKWHEIQCALSTNVADGTVDFAQRRSRTHIREICGSLVNALSGDRLELVHSTAKDYLVRAAFVDARSTECYLASLCSSYLTFECFDEDLDQNKRRDFLLQGYFAFQDYAVAHWSDHMSRIITNGPRESQQDLVDAAQLESSVVNFAAHYHLNHEEQNTAVGDAKSCSQWKESSVFDDICHIFHHVERQKGRGLNGLDEISPKSLDHAVNSSRAVLEAHARSIDIDITLVKDLIMKYGNNWFKCPKATCYYFHEGFGDLRSRDYHVSRHEQPFRCKFSDCESGYKLGFRTQKELIKHVSIYHPEKGNIVATFTRLKRGREKSEESGSQSPSRAKNPATFACTLCPKRFTRQATLNTHMLTHANERPFKCSKCERSFARRNDRERHERIHSGERKFVCRGELKHAVPEYNTWGCGKAFPRADALESHFRSEAARTCLQPLRDEEERERQWQFQVEQRKAQGFQLPPLPQQLFDLYPELQRNDDPLDTRQASDERLDLHHRNFSSRFQDARHQWTSHNAVMSLELAVRSDGETPSGGLAEEDF
ncbi:hypothetical protein PV11_07289 [Exophiala sideris]|uniref:C2H2-type domain-containing protein n=1 Tax=Exophiala sideris TaxID=1016849 RepID=A0A0D1YFS8_9EURO|nr:hypothetical protein PV11_07289 [Exophiala sideris]